jgi:ATP-dependent DNA helicase RecG
MILYGDLDVSVIDEMPAGRGAVETYIVKQAEIEKVYDRVAEEVREGRQAFFVYPIIEESKNADLKNAIDSYKQLKDDIFKDMNVGLLHGRLNDDDKDRIMNMFKDRKYDILVATTVVEVGVDVPNATVIVIEQAERFGLSNIHQLRGRIGRGNDRSYCYLVPDRSTSRDAFNRLRILQDTSDGFKIAEQDLRRRGPGDVLGRRQSGIPYFIIEDFEVNTNLIYRAQKSIY